LGFWLWDFDAQGLHPLVGFSLPGGDLAADFLEITHLHGSGQPAVSPRAAAFQFGGDHPLLSPFSCHGRTAE
jgi:hypothetical protein